MRLIIDIKTEEQYRLLQEVCFKYGAGWGQHGSHQYYVFVCELMAIRGGYVRVGIYLESGCKGRMFTDLRHVDLPDDIHISPERIAYEITN
jgi:hypothetical protein